FHGGVMGPRFSPGFRPGFNPAFRNGFAFRHGFNPGFRPVFRPGFGFNNGFRFFHGPSVVVSPFFGFPFFSSWSPYYYSQPIYTAPTYVAPDVTTSSVSDQTADNLRLQIQQLTNEIQQLQSQLIVAGQYPATPATPTQNPVSVVLVLKDGRHIE